MPEVKEIHNIALQYGDKAEMCKCRQPVYKMKLLSIIVKK